MQKTLLKVVQTYLTYTGGFYVDSIFESDESQSVADIAERVLFTLYDVYRNSQFSEEVRTLDAVSDPDHPNYLKIPERVHRIQNSKVYYNVARESLDEIVNYRLLTYLTPHEFLEELQKSVKSDTQNYIVVQDFNNTKFPVQTNKPPRYYTSFDGEYIIFDSYDSQEDTTLQESKSRVFSSESVVFLMEDDFVIPLPDHLHELYTDLVLVEAYEAIRQEPAPTSVQRRARAGWIKLQQDSRRIGNTGRKKHKYGRRK